MATAAAGSAVLLGSSQLVEGADMRELLMLRLVAVFAVVLAGLMVYRRANERRVQLELEAVSQTAQEELGRAKDQFIANVSHGLRTPLTGIVGFSQLLQESLTTPQDRESVNMILAEAAELSRTVDDLLMAARLDAEVLDTEAKDVPISSQVEEAISFMHLLGAQVNVDCVDATVRVDPERFRQVLRNLLVNAHRHGRPQVVLRGRVQHGRYICQVIDHGPGIPEETQHQLFRRFAHPPSRVTGHVGLGLSIVQELCRRMDAEVSYRRTRGETHFILSLPLATDTTHDAVDSEEAEGRMVRIPEEPTRVRSRQVRVPA